MAKWLSITVLVGTFVMSWQHTSVAQPLTLSGFVCNVSWVSPEQNSAGGLFGFLAGSLHTEPFCQGSFIDFFSLHSTGQTLDPQNHAFTQEQLMRMFQIIQSQMIAGLRISMFSLPTTAGSFRGISSVTAEHTPR